MYCDLLFSLLSNSELTESGIKVYCGAAQTAAITESGEMYHWGQVGDDVITAPSLVKVTYLVAFLYRVFN